VEADDGWRKFFEEFGSLFAEREAGGAGGDAGGVNLKTSVGGRKSRPCFDRLSTNGIFSTHPTGELPFALSSPRSGRVEGLSRHQQRFPGSCRRAAGAVFSATFKTGPLRYLCVSTMEQPDIGIYPDSGKFFVLAGSPPGGDKDKRSFTHIGRLADAVDYWDGEG
jgi:hypothetical protein